MIFIKALHGRVPSRYTLKLIPTEKPYQLWPLSQTASHLKIYPTASTLELIPKRSRTSVIIVRNSEKALHGWVPSHWYTSIFQYSYRFLRNQYRCEHLNHKSMLLLNVSIIFSGNTGTAKMSQNSWPILRHSSIWWPEVYFVQKFFVQKVHLTHNIRTHTKIMRNRISAGIVIKALQYVTTSSVT